MGTKLSLVVGGVCYFFWVFCFLAPSFKSQFPDSDSFIFNRGFITFLLFFTATINGFGAGILWVAQGQYVSDCASDKNKGFFFSYFWAWFMSSQIIGNLLAALILGNFEQSTFYIIVSVAAFLGAMIFLLLRRPKKLNLHLSQGPNGEEIKRDSDSIQLLSSDQVANEKPQSSFLEDIRQTVKLMFSRKMVLVIPLIVWSAMSLAAQSGCFVVMMNTTMKEDYPLWSDSKKLEYSLFAMVPLGLGEVMGGFAHGFVADRYGQRAGVLYLMAITAVSFAISFAYIGIWSFSVLTFFVTFAWGIQDSGLNNLLNCVLGFEFESNIIPFSILKFLQSLANFIFLVIESFLNEKIDFLIYFIAIGIFCYFSLTIMLFFPFKAKKEDNEKLQKEEERESLNDLKESGLTQE
ncbi:major facilitator superfamily protein [Stylonychia lemnae]|uniref:UNC93-like protein MFSD11 n=1 Tax=Stylonychia lemnae TaxID=5949 RepID=A0A078A4N7_STYLE|nr:major facilitator superfamily protein [Stylonychia lemnae]|eukprot:CDW76468.1 major facilitator superfamily protein [Stylonychia lemnae]